MNTGTAFSHLSICLYAALQLAFFGHLFADRVRRGAGHLVLARFLIFGFAGQELDGIGGKHAFELLVAGHEKCDEAIVGHFPLYDILTRKTPHEWVWITKTIGRARF